ncbi:MAG TPA: NAD(P)H-binding protein [Acetobacteraceae bacterium]|nr:NAD(P)H-binding protein [Acetobacteraceae bacterium]
MLAAMSSFPVHVIGASGRSGRALAQKLGSRIVPVVRDAAKWAAHGFGLTPIVADLTDPSSLAQALRGATHVMSCAHARFAPQVIAAAPEQATLVLLGSTRKFTRWPDAHGNGVLAGEAAFLASGRAGVMLHPTMIYGAEGEDNVQRLAVLIRRLPLLPLPGGGRSLVQPIHQSDVTQAILAALEHPWAGPHAMVIAGPEPITYFDFIQAIASASRSRRPTTLTVPAGSLIALAPLTRFLPGLPTIEAAEIRRLLEDKAFDIGPMRAALGFTPISLHEGLALTFAPRHRRGQD